jgi:hypothetical protein
VNLNISFCSHNKIMSQQPPPQMPGGLPPFPMPPAGFPGGVPPPGGMNMPPPGFPLNGPTAGFPPAGAPFTGAAPPPSQPSMVNGIPVAKQPLNTTPSRTVYVSNLNEKVKLDGIYIYVDLQPLRG